MRFISTRGRSPPVGLGTALLAGLAPDAGLYVPEQIPCLADSDFSDCHSLAETGQRLLAPYFAGDPLAAELPAICANALDLPTPLVALEPPGDFLLELFHGPTAAFKDIGARFLGECMARLRAADPRDLTILVATSGDTGAAVAAAFHGRPGLRVVILHPQGRVSPRQAHQLGCFGDNVRSFAVAGSFDDCQALVKRALGDAELQQRLPMSSANSISLGRLLPQMAYYAHAALEHWRSRAVALNFVVPTGNLGNATAAALARAMGLPIDRIVLATNANDVLPEFFSGKAYSPRASIATLANAMDVGAPSNFERLRWLFPSERQLRAGFDARAVTDDSIRDTITAMHAHLGRDLCPHTATALHVLTQLRHEGVGGDWAVVATAHPAKFDAIVEALTGSAVALPPALAAMLARPARHEPLAADYAALRGHLLSIAAD